MADLAGYFIPLDEPFSSGYTPRRLDYPAFEAALFVVDSSPPLISNIAPTPGTEISRVQVLGFDVTDDRGLAAVLVYAFFAATMATELVHDSAGFRFPYQSSERTAIAGGWHYEVTRSGGWPLPPGELTPTVSFVAHAIDQQGNQNT